MKLTKQHGVFVVTSKYDHEGYEENRKYRFTKIEDVLNFLNGKIVFDIYDNRQYQDSYEIVVDVCEETEYKLDWELDKENDYVWTI